jgi:hypothetical protein
VTATFTNPASITTGSESYTVTATDAADSQTASASSDLHFTDDLALNAYQTPWPRPSASSSQSGYSPYLAVDGSTSTYWVSGGPPPTPSTPVDFEENFGSPVSVGSVTMTPRAGWGPTAYTIQVSPDGTNWTTVATVSAAEDGSTTTSLAPVTTQYLRLVMTGTYQGSGDTDQIEELSISSPPTTT